MAPMRRALLVVAAVLLCALPGCAGQQRVSVPLYHLNVNNQVRDGVYLRARLGQPSHQQEVAVLVDTGSSTLAVPPSAGAAQCYTPQSEFGESCVTTLCATNAPADASGCVFGAFDPAASPLFTADPGSAANCSTALTDGHCGLTVQYGNGGEGFEGYWGQDLLSFEGSETDTARVAFGAITALEPGFSEAPAAGIFGVGFDSLNCLPATFQSAQFPETCRPNALTQWLEGRGLPNQFSMCLGDHTKPGQLILGATDPTRYNGTLQETPVTRRPNPSAYGFFGVTIESMGVSGATVSPGAVTVLNNGQPILDSGTSGLSLPGNTMEELNSAKTCSADSDCVLEVTLQGGVTLRAPHLMFCASNGQCAIDPNWFVGVSQSTILGYGLLRNYYIVYDKANKVVQFGTPTPACYTYNPPSKSTKGGLSPILIAAIVVLVIAVLVGVAVFWYCSAAASHRKPARYYQTMTQYSHHDNVFTDPGAGTAASSAGQGDTAYELFDDADVGL